MLLQEATLDPDLAWGTGVEIQCTCGAKLLLWDTRCQTCGIKNPFHRLLKKRKRFDRWLTRQIESGPATKVRQANRLFEIARNYNRTLADTLERPFPKRSRAETLKLFLKRVRTFFQSLFRSTSPARLARELDSQMDPSALAIAQVAWSESQRILSEVTGGSLEPVPQQPLLRESERVRGDLLKMATPYLQALKATQLFHSRMLTAYVPVQMILEREYSAGFVRTFWDKVRSRFKPVGQLLRFGTAVWRNTQEREQLERFESEILRFHEQAKRFLDQYRQMEERQAILLKTYKLSLRKHLNKRIVERISATSPFDRGKMTDRVLFRKGVGSLLWRLLHTVRMRRKSRA